MYCGGRTEYLKSHNIFAEMGENVLFQPIKLPNEPKLIKIHNNVKIAADVTFYTHDIINSVFSGIDKEHYQTHGECIEIFDNVFVGGHSIIIGGVTIAQIQLLQQEVLSQRTFPVASLWEEIPLGLLESLMNFMQSVVFMKWEQADWIQMSGQTNYGRSFMKVKVVHENRRCNTFSYG